MIDLMTRIQSPKLYDRMLRSAKNTAYSEINSLFETDNVGLPKCAETYNRLASLSKADILCFVEDDIEFLSNDWDRIAEDLFAEYDIDILGVVGASSYHGGGPFDAGRGNSYGLIACNKSKNDQDTWVRILSPYYRYRKVKVIDGSLMFVRKSFWNREPFDEVTFDELFFHDRDLCLKSDNVAITCDILAKHSKPPEFYGKYPKNMKPMSAYESILLDRHGITKQPAASQMCCFVAYATFKTYGQTESFNNFQKKYVPKEAILAR